MKLIDNFLNYITMYRLVLYFLIVLLVYAGFLSLFNLLPFTPIALAMTTAFILSVAWVTNRIFAYVFKVPTNVESVYISALILALIISPFKELNQLPFIFWASVWASASKFIFAFHKKHIFNPAAFAVFVTSIAITGSASWWVGTLLMLPVVLIGGLLIVKKIRRFDLFFAFLGAALITIFSLSLLKGADPMTLLIKIFADSPILFFGFVMLTEPLTTPPTRYLRLIYGIMVGVLFAPQLNIAGFTTTPELALLIGNLFSYIVSPQDKLYLKLQDKIKLSPNIYDFVYAMDRKFNFIPGQYMEWTLNVPNPDTRGNRRYFTIASSPTENNMRIGVRFSDNGSSFKKELLEQNVGEVTIASSLSGDFTLPKDQAKKLVYIAGGIGVTPFRSMLKYLIDTNQKRDITLFYSVKAASDAVYMDVFREAENKLGIKTVLVVSDTQGNLTAEMIEKTVPDYKTRTFYISGPHGMIDAFKDTLTKEGVAKRQIITDYFPGYA